MLTPWVVRSLSKLEAIRKQYGQTKSDQTSRRTVIGVSCIREGQPGFYLLPALNPSPIVPRNQEV
jgi:hypothetical protein